METNLVNVKVLKGKAKMMKQDNDILYAKAVTCRDIDDNVLDMKYALLSIFTEDEIGSILDMVVNAHPDYNGKDNLINGYLRKLRTVFEGEIE